MGATTRIRVASPADAPAVARIGRDALPSQYAGLVDPVAVAAAVEQSYAHDVVTDCIARCAGDAGAHFLVAEDAGGVTGFLHFDSFGPEPELHRLYVSADARGGGLGGLLMEALHERLGNAPGYMLLVVAGNDRAVRFYERHGLHVAEAVDGLTYYRERMGVEFPTATRPFELLLLRRDPPA